MTFDAADVIARARRMTGRSFASRDLVVLPRDGFVLVVLADDLLAYVSTDDDHRRRLATERKVLARIASRVSFAVPRPVGPLDLTGDLDLRVPAPGATGPAHHARIMADPALARDVGTWMGCALAELHAALGPSELDALAVPRPDWPQAPARLARGVDAHLEGATRDAAHEVLRLWHARPPQREVFLHGDFGSHNFAFDSNTGKPTGVFDFHDGGRGPRVVDLALLPSYGEEITLHALAAYGADAPPLDDVRLAHAVKSIAYLAWRAEDPDAHDLRSGRDRSAAVAWAEKSVGAVAGASA
jgi:hypothetical protein